VARSYSLQQRQPPHLSKRSCLHPIEINPTRQPLAIKSNAIPTRLLDRIHQRGDFLAEDIVNFEAHVFGLRQFVTDRRRWVEWVGIILQQRVLLRDRLSGRIPHRGHRALREKDVVNPRAIVARRKNAFFFGKSILSCGHLQ